PGAIVLDDGAGISIRTAQGAHRRVPPGEMTAKIGAVLMIVLMLPITTVWTLWWVVAALRGRVTGWGGITTRLAPTVAFSLALGAIAAPMLLLQVDDLEVLGRATAAAWSVYGLSLLAPLSIGAAAWLVWRGQAGLPRGVAMLGWLQLFCATVICAYLGYHGWLGLRMWEA
ncbi:MAG: hypothetical protein SF002_14100, partial [Alphaproteobacteria bacterium]|nr:hypothetical protein [Alphaproteobacteria bacterium]